MSNRYYIRKVNFTTGADTIFLKDLAHTVAIDFDYEGQMLYWTDIQSQNSFIYRTPLNSTEPQKHVQVRFLGQPQFSARLSTKK